jgi:hypothetical protein
MILLDGERTTPITLPLPPETLAEATGWTLQPEGLCKDGVCVPVRDTGALVGADGIDLAGFAQALHRPLVIDAEAGVAALGESVGDLSRRLHALEAPDFTLPDLDGVLHSFGAIGRKKKLLVVWSSW